MSPPPGASSLLADGIGDTERKQSLGCLFVFLFFFSTLHSFRLDYIRQLVEYKKPGGFVPGSWTAADASDNYRTFDYPAKSLAPHYTKSAAWKPSTQRVMDRVAGQLFGLLRRDDEPPPPADPAAELLKLLQDPFSGQVSSRRRLRTNGAWLWIWSPRKMCSCLIAMHICMALRNRGLPVPHSSHRRRSGPRSGRQWASRRASRWHSPSCGPTTRSCTRQR